MPLSIKNPEADRLARKLAAVTGEGLTEAVVKALRERLERHLAGRRPPRLDQELLAIGRRCSALPLLDDRPTDAIVGYDRHGIPS